jgi:hypothetical protein
MTLQQLQKRFEDLKKQANLDQNIYSSSYYTTQELINLIEELLILKDNAKQ